MHYLYVRLLSVVLFEHMHKPWNEGGMPWCSKHYTTAVRDTQTPASPLELKSEGQLYWKLRILWKISKLLDWLRDYLVTVHQVDCWRGNVCMADETATQLHKIATERSYFISNCTILHSHTMLSCMLCGSGHHRLTQQWNKAKHLGWAPATV